MKIILFPIVMLVLFFAVTLSSGVSEAQESGAMRAPAAANGANSIQRKRYPGGADEDDLQVQATLPIPSRTLDGIPSLNSAPSGESGSEGSVPPAND